MRLTGFLIIGWFVLGFSFSRCGGNSDVIDTVACPIAGVVSKVSVAEPYYNKKVQLKTEVFYRANEARRAWLKKNRTDRMFDAFVQAVKESPHYGFNPDQYHIDELEAAVEELYDSRERTNADISALDIRITASFFLFTTHLIEGRVRYPGAREFFWKRGMPLENDIALLLKMESVADLRKELGDLHPKDPQYEKLQEALERYRDLQKADTLPVVSGGLNLSPGETHQEVSLVRRRLEVRGYEIDGPDSSTRYDDELAEAVKDFQMRHGLESDGVLNRQTIRIMNTLLQEKLDLIALNLERLRWRPHLRGEGDEIVINVPEYMLRAYKQGKERLRMRVVLGAAYTPTPVFQDTLKYIVFSPTWIVPRSIFENEFYPRLRDDPEHFSAERFRFFKDGKEIDPAEEDWTDKKFDISKYGVVENPGEVNSLGKVKFIMPNDFSVYLHDTPADKLFGRHKRALSHGCIRLEDPRGFAEYLLADNREWSSEKISEAMNSGEPVKVDLTRSYPVYIVYRTVWVDDEDRVHFRNDIYGHDERHLASLK